MHHRQAVAGFILVGSLWAGAAHAGGNIIDPYTQFPPAGGGGAAYEAIGTTFATDFTGSTADIDVPAGVANGDCLLLIYGWDGYGSAPSATGWSSAKNQTNGYWGTSASALIHYVTDAGSEDDPVTFAVESGYAATGAIVRLSNCTGVDDATSASSEGTAPNSHVAPDVTASESAGIIISVASLRGLSIQPGWTSNPDTTVLAFEGPGDASTRVPLAISYDAYVSSGTQGTQTFTSTTARNDVTLSIAVY